MVAAVLVMMGAVGPTSVVAAVVVVVVVVVFVPFPFVVVVVVVIVVVAKGSGAIVRISLGPICPKTTMKLVARKT